MSQAKGLSINIISHEMRTPLAVMQGAVDLMEHCGDRLTDGEKMDYLREIKKCILRMTRTMDTVTLLGKVQDNQLSFQPLQTDVVKFCRNIVNEAESLNDGRKIVLQVSKSFPYTLNMDTTLLYHIVSNLLSNAVKYSEPDKLVHIKLVYESEVLTIYVKDSGIGIPSGEMKEIFKLFHRGSNVKFHKGMGIGMFIVKHCVSINGGTISVDSKENVGTTFKVSLPMFPKT